MNVSRRIIRGKTCGTGEHTPLKSRICPGSKKKKLNRAADMALFIAAFLIILMIGSKSWCSESIILARDGRTEYVIARGKSPEPAEITAAEKLSEFLGRVTGAEFEIVAEDAAGAGGAAIYVGWTEFASREGIDHTEFAPEEWLIKTAGNNLIITGGRPRGTINGAFEFLESEAGVLALDVLTVAVPSRKTLSTGRLNSRGRPAFMNSIMSDPPRFYRTERERYADQDFFFAFNKNDTYWRRRPQYGLSRKIGSGGHVHTMGRYLHPDEYGETNPEYFAMHRRADGTLFRNIDARGTRNQWFDHCLSNREVRDIFKKRVRARIQDDRKDAVSRNLRAPFIYTVDQNDCLPGHACLCPDCREIVEREGAESGLLIDFINEIADDIGRDYPEIYIQTLAYNHTLEPPEHIRPAGNVMIWWCYSYGVKDYFHPITHEYNAQLRETFEAWRDISGSMSIYDYWRRFQRGVPGFHAPFSYVGTLQDDIRYFYDNNVKALYVSGSEYQPARPPNYDGNLHSFHPLNTWLGMKLMQDPLRDREPLLDMFFDGFYGPAAGYMRQYLNYLEMRQGEWGRPVTNRTVRQREWYRGHLDLAFFMEADRLFNSALDACGDDGFHSARVKRERLVADAALLHLEPRLRRKYSAEGQPFPFNRADVLERHKADWDAYLEAYWMDDELEQARENIKSKLEFISSMPMITAESINHRAVFTPEGDITIDGMLDEPAWADAEPLYLTLRTVDGLDTLKAGTAVRLLWSEKHLYAAFECFKDRIGEMKYGEESGSSLWRESSVEIFLNPGGDRENYYQIIVNPAGEIAENAVRTLEGQRDYDWTWESGARTAVRVREDSWVVEIAVPFDALNYKPRADKALVANFGRNMHIVGEPGASQHTTWSPLVRGFHDLENFGRVILGDAGVLPLTSFDGYAGEMPVITPAGECGISFSSEKVSFGSHSLRIAFHASDRARGPDIEFKEYTDWTGYEELLADIFLEGEDSFLCTARITLENGERYYQQRTLRPGWNRDARLFDLTRGDAGEQMGSVAALYIYRGQSSPLVMHLDNMRLSAKKR